MTRLPKRTAPRRSLALIGGGLFAVTLIYLLAYRNEGIFHLDAVYLAQTVEGLYGGVWQLGWRAGAVLANALVYLPFWLAGENAERATVVASILFHALSVPLAFAFVTRLTGSPLQAALSAGLFALAPVYTIANTFGKEYGLAMLVVLAAFERAVAAHDRGRAAPAALSGLLFALSYTVWEGLLLATPIYLVLLFAPRELRRAPPPAQRRVAAGAAVGYAIGVGIALATSLWTMLQIYAAADHMTRVDHPAASLTMAAADLIYFLGWPLLAASACGAALAWGQAEYRPIRYAATLLVATGAVYGALNTYGPRYLALCALGLSMFAGAAFHQLTCLAATRTLGLVAYAMTLAVMLAAARPLLVARRDFNGPKRYAQYLAEVTEPNSLIIVTDESRFIEYYAHRAVLDHPIGNREAIDAWANGLVRESERRAVYLTDSGLSYDPGRLVRQALDQRFTRVLIGTRPTEDYHHAERQLRPYDGHLWRLLAK
jgi:hypothetical protein